MFSGVLDKGQSMNGVNDKDIDRFWKYVDKKGEEECWINTIAPTHRYGRLKIKGKNVRMNRLSYILHKGSIPVGLCVCHTCDVPRCVNPVHLFVGTMADNVRDRDNKDRLSRGAKHSKIMKQIAVRGSKHPSAVLNEEDVYNIRQLKDTVGYTYKELSDIFGVHKKTIGQIIRKERWRHI